MKFVSIVINLALAFTAIAAPTGGDDGQQCSSGEVKSCCNAPAGLDLVDAVLCNVLDIASPTCNSGNVYCCDTNAVSFGLISEVLLRLNER